MKILFKTLLAVTGILLMVVAALGILLATVDPDAHRQRIADLISSQTGIDVELGGELSLSYYPWLGASINDVTLPAPSGYGEAPLFHADSARVRVRLLPLLSGRYEIDTLRLHGADINLVIDESGRANWRQMAGSTGESTAPSPAEDTAGLPLANVIVGGVDIRDARLALEDRQQQRRYTIDNLALRTGELVYGDPISVEMNLEGSASQPALSTNARLDGVIAYSDDGQRYEIEPLRLDMSLSGARVPDGNTEIGMDAAINLDLAADTLNISRLVVNGPGLSLTGTLRGRGVQTAAPSYRSQLQLNGNDLVALFEMAGHEQLAARMTAVDSRRFSISSDMRLDLAEGSLELPQLELQLLGASVSGQLDASGINDSDAYRMNGSLTAEGPDLPLLLQLAGQLQGSDSALERYGRQLADLPDGAFNFDTRFDVDWQQGDIEVPLLRTETMGLRLDARLSASDMRFDAGRVNGRIRLTGSNLQDLLAALDQPLLADRLQDLTLETDISGTRAGIRIAPLNLSSTVVPPGEDSAQTWRFNAEGEVTPADRQLTLEQFAVAGPQFDLSGRLEASDLLTAPQMSGELDLSPMNPRRLLQQWNRPLPDSTGQPVFQRLALRTQFEGDGNRLALEQLALTVDETTVNGRLAIEDFQQPATRFTLDMDRLDLDRYLAVTTDGDSDGSAGTALPLEPLRTLSADGSLEIGEFTVGGMRLSDISADISAGDGRLEVSPLRSQLYQGSYAGDLALDVSGATPRLQLDSNIENLALEPLLTALANASHVRGNGQLQLSLTSQGATVTDLKRNLNGQGEMAIEDGALSGIDIGSTLAQIETMIRSGRVMAVERGQETPFETFSATLAISQGAVTTNDLLIRAPGFRVEGGGLLADLADNRIDFRLRTTVERGTATTADQTHDIGGYTLPIACRGSLDAPGCAPDVEAVLRQAAGNLLERRIGDFLEDRLGSQQDAPQQDNTDSGDEPRNASDPARELLDRTLDEIFR